MEEKPKLSFLLAYLVKYSSSYKLSVLAGAVHSIRMLIGTFHTIYLLDAGLSIGKISLLQAVFSATMVFFVYAAGKIADKYNCKRNVLFSLGCVAIFYLSCLYAPNLFILIIGEVFYGLGLAVFCTSSQVWKIGSINKESPGDEKKIDYYNYLENEVFAFGSIICAIIGATIAYFGGSDYTYVYITSFFLMLLSGILYSVLPYSSVIYTQRNVTYGIHFKRIISNSYFVLFSLTTGILTAVYQPLYHFWQPLFKDILSKSDGAMLLELNITNYMLIAFLSMSILKLFTFKFLRSNANRTEDSNNVILAVLFSLLAAGHFCILSFYKDSYTFTVLVFSLLHVYLAVFYTVCRNFFIKRVDAENLGKYIATNELFNRISGIILLLAISFLDSTLSISVLFKCCGLLCLIMAITFSIYIRVAK